MNYKIKYAEELQIGDHIQLYNHEDKPILHKIEQIILPIDKTKNIMVIVTKGKAIAYRTKDKIKAYNPEVF